MGPVPYPNVKTNELPSERAIRNTRKHRQWDMAYEGDADWDYLMHNENFIADNQEEDDNLVRKREKLKLSNMFSDAKIGRSAAVSYGLKARAAIPLEKIRFKEVLKRKGGLQMYLECRFVISSKFDTAFRCINLFLSNCMLAGVLLLVMHQLIPCFLKYQLVFVCMFFLHHTDIFSLSSFFLN